ncbi:hypothetical protein [Rubrobacter indicoceani]|uniref:hypothetical protein n=1 Tax=Rubrobacter indicoceani TaxID=2051957 RepID=UPI000E5A5BE9|nr:hypothetical protein [Rubrobacter indicoceani]
MFALVKKNLTAFMVALAVMVTFAAPSFAQAGPVSQFQSNAVENAGLAVGLVVAVVLILSAVSLALWGLRKAGAGK